MDEHYGTSCSTVQEVFDPNKSSFDEPSDPSQKDYKDRVNTGPQQPFNYLGF
jgi:hypothetical protein